MSDNIEKVPPLLTHTVVSIISGWPHNRKGEEVRLYVHIYTHILMIILSING